MCDDIGLYTGIVEGDLSGMPHPLNVISHSNIYSSISSFSLVMVDNKSYVNYA